METALFYDDDWIDFDFSTIQLVVGVFELLGLGHCNRLYFVALVLRSVAEREARGASAAEAPADASKNQYLAFVYSL